MHQDPTKAAEEHFNNFSAVRRPLRFYTGPEPATAAHTPLQCFQTLHLDASSVLATNLVHKHRLVHHALARRP